MIHKTLLSCKKPSCTCTCILYILNYIYTYIDIDIDINVTYLRYIHTCIHTYIHTYAHMHIHKQASRQAGRQADRHTNVHIWHEYNIIQLPMEPPFAIVAKRTSQSFHISTVYIHKNRTRSGLQQFLSPLDQYADSSDDSLTPQ